MLIIFFVVGCSSQPSNQEALIKQSISYLDEHQINQLTADVKSLSSDAMAGRKFATAGSTIAQNYIIESLVSSNVLPFQGNYRHSFTKNNFFNEQSGNNIIGMVKGKTHSKKYIVISAHYDHLGKKRSKIFNGADDNASGTAAVLSFADLIANKPLNHNVIFLFTDGEEIDLLGAKSFITQQKSLLHHIALNINIDMIAGSKQTKKLQYIDNHLETILTKDNIDKLNSLENSSTASVKRGFKRNFNSAHTKTNWFNASDHAVFNEQKIPFIYFGVGEHKNYHTDKDDFEHINLPFYIKASQTIFHYVTFLDQNIVTSNKNLTN